MKRLLLLVSLASLGLGLVLFLMPARAQQAAPPVIPVDVFDVSLRDGDLISASDYGDPDIYIINFKRFSEFGTDGIFRNYNGAKRLFLNPTIFNFYGHLGGFGNVRRVSPQVRDSFLTSGLFRNCETDDQRVWAVEVTGEDAGIFHHVQMSGSAAVLEDAHFFKKVFCINSNEERWYAKSIFPYTKLADVPRYSRSVPPGPFSCARFGQIPTPGDKPCCAGFTPVDEPGSPVGVVVCRHAPSPTCVREGQVHAGEGIIGQRCCSGLESSELRSTNLREVGGPFYCTRPGCYYQRVTCVTSPCDPVLVCPSPTPCVPLPTCAQRNHPDYDPACDLSPLPIGQRYCQSCEPPPDCLFTNPQCLVAVPEGGWCPRPSPGPCYIGGCSGQICSDDPNAVSTCEFRPEYACYRTGTCERQPTGLCGWTQTSDLLSCLGPPDAVREFTITADDSSFESSSALLVRQGDLVRLTFNVRTTNVEFGGLDFRSDIASTGTILPGGSKTIEFTANNNVVFRSFWPGSGVMKPYTIIVSVTVE